MGKEENVRHKCGHVGDARHQTEDHCPTKIGTVELSGLLYNGANSVSFDDAPHEEGDTRNGHYDCLECEQVSAMHKDVSDLVIL